MLYTPSRHEPLIDAAWDEAATRDAIARIAVRTEAALDVRSGTWPLHPRDVEDGDARPKRGLYLGAAGVIWALVELAESGHAELGRDHSELAANLDNPAGELLYGNPGTMVVAAALHERTGEARWAELWRRGAERVLASWRPDEALGVELWTQELFGAGPQRYIGAGHGLAGNARSLLRGGLLARTERHEVERRAVAALTRLAVVEDGRANWPPLADRPLTGPDGRIRTQWCHGAPGIVTSLAMAAADDDAWTSLLVAAGRLVLDAGAIRDNAGICHGTAGNGYAMLALWQRTGDDLWLARARRFATHAAAQLEAIVAREGGGRHALFTGDLGVALYLRACIDGDARIPTLDWL